MYPSRDRFGSPSLRRGTSRFARVALGVVLISPFGAVEAQPAPDSSGFITSADGARLFYAIYGQAKDTVIIPLGALLAQHLSVLREDLTLVFYDPRGRGKSDWIADPKRVTMADEVRDLDAVRAGLGISRAALVGFSYQGLVTAIYAADNPTRVTRLALLGPMAPDEQTTSRYAPPEGRIRADSAAAKFARARAAASDTSDHVAECRRWYDAYAPLYVGDPGAADSVTTEFCANENELPGRFLWRVSQTLRSLPRRWDYSKKAATIRAPTLVIQGDRDFAVSPDGARRWAELIPNARLIMLAGAGHLTYIERSDRVIPALARFLRGEWPPESMQLRTTPR